MGEGSSEAPGAAGRRLRLTPRLRAVLGAVPAAGSVADIGAGGGQLALALRGRGLKVIATELTVPGYALLPAELERRRGDGLQALLPGEVEGAVLTGLGGHSIIRILSRSPVVVASLAWLVLQPQQHLQALERWLNDAGYRVQQRSGVMERGRHYTVLRATPPA
ncbi:MAG: class I SAM-dependent methyltransferase [Candidatus Dormibacteraeota bacterium]|nr:class I SAM-dependent methyltransferase [Candidatus Dormibacteraeota bacterium]